MSVWLNTEDRSDKYEEVLIPNPYMGDANPSMSDSYMD